MIRFSCPGCSATFSVGDDKAGKAGKCPKCESQFMIPAAEGAEVPSKPTASDEAVEISPCPKCAARLTVSASDLGLEVECPYCKAVYRAERPGAPKPSTGSKASLSDALSGGNKGRVAREDDEEAEERPSRRRRAEVDDDEEERPSRRRRRDDDDNEDERPSRRRARADDEERPRRKKRRRHTEESKRMTAALLAFFLGGYGVHKFYLGYSNAGVIMLVLGLFTCGIVSGMIALVEFIIYLTKSDEDFVEMYQLNQKEWF
jgi:predicted Zn finger-like uncharacterized protein